MTTPRRSADHTTAPVSADAALGSPPNLRDASLLGVRWMTAARVGAEMIAVASSLVLARLLVPADFGRAAVALAVIPLGSIVATQAFGAPLVQRRTLDRRHIESAALLSLCVGGLLAIAIAIVGLLVVRPFVGSTIGILVSVAAAAFVIAAPAAVPRALLTRDLDFRKLGIIEAAGILVAAVTSVVLALAGLGAAALVGGVLTGTAAVTGLLVFGGPTVAPHWDRSAAEDVVRFGAPAALSGAAYSLFQNVDYIILAARLGPAQTGQYWRAYNLGVEYQGKVSGVMLRVAFPVYARTRDLAEMRRIRNRIVRAHSVALFPFLTTLVATAPVLIPLLYGDQWKPAVVPAQILAATGLAYVVSTGLGPLMLGAGRPTALLVYDVAALASYAVVVAWFSRYGLITVCAAIACYGIVIVAAQFAFVERRIGVTFGDVVGALLPASAASARSLAAAWPAASALERAGLADAVVLLVSAVVAVVAYLLPLRLLFPAAWSDCLMILRRVVSRAAPG
jgi:O-antigen/teichoic acid export membrane protein